MEEQENGVQGNIGGNANGQAKKAGWEISVEERNPTQAKRIRDGEIQMRKTTVHRAHNKKTQCSYCKQFALFKDTGYIRINVARLIDWNAIISGSFCSLDCAIKYLQEAQEKEKKKRTPSEPIR